VILFEVELRMVEKKKGDPKTSRPSNNERVKRQLDESIEFGEKVEGSTTITHFSAKPPKPSDDTNKK